MTTPLAIEELETRVEFNRLCIYCQRVELFQAAWCCEIGLIGVCRGCGGESIAPYTRTNSEAA